MRVAVLGAGYAGVTLTKQLEKRLPEDVELVLVDDTGVHLVQHELHRLVRRPSLADVITIPLTDLVDRAEVRERRVTEVDRGDRVVRFADGTTLSYDVAAVCLGAETAFYDLPGVEEHATPLKRLEHATHIREEFDAVRERDGHVVVGGAGLSGVQVAGELAQVAADDREATAQAEAAEQEEVRISLDEADAESETDEAVDAVGPTDDEFDQGFEDFGEVDTLPEEGVTVTLLEQFDSVAPNFPERFQRAVHDELVERGVDVQTGATVERATADAVHLADGTTIEYDQFIWTGGIRGPDAMAGDRPVVRSTLSLDRTTFVVGDAARMVDDDGEAVPASSQSAIRAARVAAENIDRMVDHLRDGDPGDFDPRLDRFDFDSPGWLVSVGDGAVAQVGPTVFTGTAALALKATVGGGYLSSVGAVRNAVDLVNSELGIDPGDD
ncbi:NAD(P)/FAD-dependent oxidoreductase [Haloarchaeobius iranensis]|uniref:NADH dehydrogenase n=1 Tax=Haloarchaeobius iranensis TaxID=996166 RepID=A0A1G9WIQ4_9EURY|nr:FAD-dependent oxidoreductase [Haloarchaeobius iranensis]SDM84046.1 NADH dehydrogenase [Haloarchaeobius iranensis]